MDAKEAVKEFKELGTRSLRTTGDCIEDEYKEVYEFVLSALEKQVPKKPIHSKCPNCHSDNIEVWQDGGYMPTRFFACPDCAQKIDWSDA